VSGIPRAKFPKSAHLLKHADFRRVYENGRRHFSGNLTAFYLRRPPEANLAEAAAVRVGFTVGKPLGGSVDRNRIRRRVREAVRFHMSILSGISESLDIVINPKKSVLKVEFSVLSEEVSRAFEVIRQKIERPSNSGTPAKTGFQSPGA
jgi:ribonuclease P protein component